MLQFLKFQMFSMLEGVIKKMGKEIVVFRDPEHHFCVYWKLKLQREKLCFQNYLYTCGWGLTVTGAPIHRIASITLSNS